MITSFLKEWVIQIVTTFIFISFLEIVLPNGEMKKYIDMIIGLIIIIVIINPFIKFLVKDINNIERSILNIPQENVEEYEMDKDVIKLQQNQIVSSYIQKLNDDIKVLIEKKTDYTVLKSFIEIKDDLESEDFGELTKVYLELDLKSDEIDDKKSNIHIEEVEIVSLNNTINKSEDVSDLVGDNEIKKIISEEYDVPESNIIVQLTENGR